jgi:hypothetical protein
MNKKRLTGCMLLAVVLAAEPSARKAAAVAHEKTPTTRQLSSELSAAPGSIDLAGAILKKGDARESVMRQLSRFYELQRLRSADGEEDSWIISERERTDNYVGVVSFAAGKVRRVARFRKRTQDDASAELAQCWCDLLEKLTTG